MAIRSANYAPGDLVGDRFVLQQQAGSGGSGTVFRAVDRLRGATVALKLCRSSRTGEGEAERFAREAGILAELHHPGIVRYVAHGISQGVPWLAMEWLEGEDLAALIARRRLSPSEVVTIARTVGEALGFAHARGVIHRDVKPSNLFLPLGDIARVVLIDFGVAHDGLDDTDASFTIVGTPAYMAPEQIHAMTEAEPSADVFSLGCVLFECLTGSAAFAGTNLFSKLAKVLFQETPRAAEAPPALDDLLGRMLAKDRRARPPNGAAVSKEIDGIDDVVARAPMMPSPVPSIAPSSSESRPFLTRDERRLVTIVVAGDPRATFVASTARRRDEVLTELGDAIAPYAARLDQVADGALIVTVWGAGSAIDRAERAARCALVIAARFPDLPIAMATGRGRVSAQAVSGEVLDGAVRALGDAIPGAIQIDETSAEMLRARFLVGGRGKALRLVRSRGADDGVTLLLGEPTPCVGRARELATIEGAIAASRERSASAAVLVVGPAGAGKSRLQREIVARCVQQGNEFSLLIGRGDLVGSGAPFSILADAIRRAAGVSRSDSRDVKHDKIAARISRHLPPARHAHVGSWLAAMSGAAMFSTSHAARASAIDPISMAEAMRAAWEEWLAAELSQSPVLLVLEDLHWADEATVRLVDSALRNLHDRPLVVLALARPEVRPRFPLLFSERALTTVALGPLPDRACARLAKEALVDRADDAVIARIVARAEGNPFHLEELIRAVAAGRGDTLPDTVLAAVEARLDAEGDDAKRVLRAASVFGERFSRDGIAALLGASSREADGDLLDLLVQRELVAPLGSPSAEGDIELVFRHDLVREAAYAMLTDADRALGHGLAGAWLEQSGHADADAVAEHFRLGGEPLRAVPWYCCAAEEALAADDLRAATERVARGLACGATGRYLASLRLTEAEALLWRGDLALAEQRGTEAMAGFVAGSPSWFRALTQVILAAGKLGAFDHVEALIADARAAEPTEGATTAQVACLSRMAIHLVFGGRYAAADALLADLDRITREAGVLEPAAAARLHEVRAVRATVAGDLGEGLDRFRDALDAFEQTSDARNACTTRSNLGFVLSELGDFAGAEVAIRAAIEGADRMGLHDLTTAGLQNLGRVLAHTRVDEARLVTQRALDAYVALGDPRMAGSTRAYLALIELSARDFAAAERIAREAVDALEAAPPLRAGALAILAKALLEQGRSNEALAASREAYTQLEATGSLEEGESTVRLIHAEALAAVGLHAEFVAIITAARERLMDRAGKISDPVWRDRFLTEVPENARTLALAAQG